LHAQALILPDKARALAPAAAVWQHCRRDGPQVPVPLATSQLRVAMSKSDTACRGLTIEQR
jgi:hypothetical protein